MEKLFNPYEWIKKTEEQQQFDTIEKPKSAAVNECEIEEIVCRIENLRIDLTSNYSDWLSIGFSLASELGAVRRGFFHRVSRFHPEYNINACNLQFDKCLRRPTGRISIRTFFYLAKIGGVNISLNNTAVGTENILRNRKRKISIILNRHRNRN